ncbi:MAG: SDR family NAD(P)-dependent oxidoreductase [Ruminococcus sp.]|nr:SDR family NAD(P)-dependent oxidoreductase [Ruminococcus sp.]MCD7959951.1 SDR family NAD(P)-dependent oxidoreductase [Ruminococcus sp.]
MRAVITGATSGIGKAIAWELSKRGWSLILTGRDENTLEKLKSTLPVPVETIALDLAEDDAPITLYRFCIGKHVDLLVNNAGFGVFGAFTETDLEDELNLLKVNIRATHILTKLFLKEFRSRNAGRILNVASSAGFLTGPLFSSYYASKNYVVRLSLAIAEELRHEKSRVTISILCPGPVNTNFNQRAGVQFKIPALTSEKVAKDAVLGALTGQLLIIPGWFVRLGVQVSRLVPERILSRINYHLQAAKKK